MAWAPATGGINLADDAHVDDNIRKMMWFAKNKSWLPEQANSVSMTDELRRSAEEILPSAKRISNLTFNPLTGEIPERKRAPSRAAYLVDLKVHRNSLGKVISLPRLRVVNFAVERHASASWTRFAQKNLTSTPVGNELECVAKDLNYLRLLPLLFRSVLFTEWPRNSGCGRVARPSPETKGVGNFGPIYLWYIFIVSSMNDTIRMIYFFPEIKYIDF